MLGNGDDFSGSFCGIFDGELISEAVIPFSHFLAGKEGQSKVVNSDGIGFAVENGDIEVGKMDDVAIFPIKNCEEMNLFF